MYYLASYRWYKNTEKFSTVKSIIKQKNEEVSNLMQCIEVQKNPMFAYLYSYYKTKFIDLIDSNPSNCLCINNFLSIWKKEVILPHKDKTCEDLLNYIKSQNIDTVSENEICIIKEGLTIHYNSFDKSIKIYSEKNKSIFRKFCGLYINDLLYSTTFYANRQINEKINNFVLNKKIEVK